MPAKCIVGYLAVPTQMKSWYILDETYWGKNKPRHLDCIWSDLMPLLICPGTQYNSPPLRSHSEPSSLLHSENQLLSSLPSVAIIPFYNIQPFTFCLTPLLRLVLGSLVPRSPITALRLLPQSLTTLWKMLSALEQKTEYKMILAVWYYQ